MKKHAIITALAAALLSAQGIAPVAPSGSLRH